VSQLRGTDGGAVAREGQDETAPDGAETAEPVAAGDEVGGTDGGSGPDAGDRRRTVVHVAAVTAVLAVPLVIAAVAVRTPRWYPLIDLAQIEMRVRDVGTRHPPMVGLGGRIFGLDSQGSHPGPVSFYLLAPVYRLLGSSAWGLQVSAAVLNLAALATTVWAGHRRWGLRGALLVAAGLALLMRMYGTTILLYPWNPYMPVLFWALFLVCVWGVLCDDLPLLPVATVAGCVCAQTHIPYVGLVGGLLGLAAGSLVLAHRRAGGDPARRHAIVRWSAASIALGLALWAPVFVQQLGGEPGNLALIIDSFRDPVDDAVGMSTAWELFPQHFDIVRLLDADRFVPGSQLRGLALLAVWAASAALAVRLRDRTLTRLHVVVGVALALGFVTVSRILGTTWFYLTLWAYGTAVLTIVAVVATAAFAVRRALATRSDAARIERLAWAPVAGLAVAILWPAGLLARTAPDTADVDAKVSDQLGAVVAPTVEAIEEGVVPGGDDGTYLITWTDPVNLGGQGMGLLLELERRGYRARARDPQVISVREHRVAEPEEADAEIHVATGLPAIAQARDHQGAREIAYHDPRTPEEIARYEHNRALVIEGLREAGLDELVPEVDTNLFHLAAVDGLPEDVVGPIYIMGTTSQPLAVFTWAPGA
jgi:hypothetical protein